MIIGNFQKQNNIYVGAIATLALNADMRIEAVEKKGDKSPDYRIYANNVEIGAGWTKTGKSENSYIAIILDDPSFSRAFHCRLIDAGEGQADLFWSRQTAPRTTK